MGHSPQVQEPQGEALEADRCILPRRCRPHGRPAPLTASADDICARYNISHRVLQEASEIYGSRTNKRVAPRWILEHGEVAVFPKRGEWGNHRGPRRG